MAPRSVDREKRRREILAAAVKVFAQYGYQRTTVDQIAEAAGIAKGSIYLSFSSKEDLFHALFEDFAREAMGHAETGGAGNDAKRGLAGVEQALLAAARAVDQDEAVIPLTLEFWSVCGVEETRERFGRSYAELFRRYRSSIVDLLADAQTRGEVEANASLEAIASCLIAMIDGLLIQQWTVPNIKASAMLQQALPLLLRSLAVPRQ